MKAIFPARRSARVVGQGHARLLPDLQEGGLVLVEVGLDPDPREVRHRVELGSRLDPHPRHDGLGRDVARDRRREGHGALGRSGRSISRIRVSGTSSSSSLSRTREGDRPRRAAPRACPRRTAPARPGARAGTPTARRGGRASRSRGSDLLPDQLPGCAHEEPFDVASALEGDLMDPALVALDQTHGADSAGEDSADGWESCECRPSRSPSCETVTAA